MTIKTCDASATYRQSHLFAEIILYWCFYSLPFHHNVAQTNTWCITVSFGDFKNNKVTMFRQKKNRGEWKNIQDINTIYKIIILHLITFWHQPTLRTIHIQTHIWTDTHSTRLQTLVLRSKGNGKSLNTHHTDDKPGHALVCVYESGWRVRT